MFRRLPDLKGEIVGFTIDGRAVTARSGDTVAAALLAAGVEVCRTTPVSGAPRGPYCMMGVCFDCLVTIDGIGNRQGCLVLIKDKMRIETQRGARALPADGPADDIVGGAAA
jgi:D-hydroxyproline dehydrogenase subunit gamma